MVVGNVGAHRVSETAVALTNSKCVSPVCWNHSGGKESTALVSLPQIECFSDIHEGWRSVSICSKTYMDAQSTRVQCATEDWK